MSKGTDGRLEAAPGIIRRAMSLFPSKGPPVFSAGLINGLTYLLKVGPEGRCSLRIKSGEHPATVFLARWRGAVDGPYDIEVFERGSWEANLPSHG